MFECSMQKELNWSLRPSEISLVGFGADVKNTDFFCNKSGKKRWYFEREIVNKVQLILVGHNGILCSYKVCWGCLLCVLGIVVSILGIGLFLWDSQIRLSRPLLWDGVTEGVYYNNIKNSTLVYEVAILRNVYTRYK